MGTFEPSYPFQWKKMAETNKQKLLVIFWPVDDIKNKKMYPDK